MLNSNLMAFLECLLHGPSWYISLRNRAEMQKEKAYDEQLNKVGIFRLKKNNLCWRFLLAALTTTILHTKPTQSSVP